MHILVNGLINFAQAYGAGTYNSSNYGGATAASGSTGSGATTAGTSGLANTGFAVVLVITAACLLIFTALLVRFWHRKKTT